MVAVSEVDLEVARAEVALLEVEVMAEAPQGVGEVDMEKAVGGWVEQLEAEIAVASSVVAAMGAAALGAPVAAAVMVRAVGAMETEEGATEAEGLEAAAMDVGPWAAEEMAVAETVVEAKVAATVEAEAAVRTTTSCPQRAPRRQSETRPAHTRSRMMRR